MTSVSTSALAEIRTHGERDYPEECCGMMLGTSDGDRHRVTKVITIDNIQEENRKRRFLISAAQYLQAERRAAEEGLELLGFYHSHPDHPAIPSDFDTEHALPWFSYIIVSVQRGTSADITSWLLRQDRTRFDQQSLEEIR
jgi:proteasome lid subunit RPN8/RPN11